MGTTVDNPKNKTCKAIELGSGAVIAEHGRSLVRKEEIIQEIDEVDETWDIKEKV